MRTGAFGSLPPPTYDLPTYPHHPGFGAETDMPMPFNVNPATAYQNMDAFQNSMGSAINVMSTSLAMSAPWQPQTPLAQAPNVEPSYFSPPPLQVETKKEDATAEQSPMLMDSPLETKDEDTPTLSPSAYFWQEITLPGCDDATGTCQCGDGCDCVGCLTHGGHNGVSLDVPVSTGPEVFSDFLAATGEIAETDLSRTVFST